VSCTDGRLKRCSQPPSPTVIQRIGGPAAAALNASHTKLLSSAHFAASTAPPPGVLTGEEAVKWFITVGGCNVKLLERVIERRLLVYKEEPGFRPGLVSALGLSGSN